MSLLVLAAWEPELERFRALKNAAVDLNMDAVGIGPVDAALGTARSLAKHQPSIVLLLGTAGAHEGCGELVGNVIVAREVGLVDPTTVEGRAAMPYASEPIRLDPILIEACVKAGATARAVGNTLGITTDDALAKILAASSSPPIEHLEAYAVARACEQANVRCAIVLGISNVVGSKGREEWRANHIEASAKAANVAARAIALF
jgi:futalosine hydrolase